MDGWKANLQKASRASDTPGSSLVALANPHGESPFLLQELSGGWRAGGGGGGRWRDKRN